jgi:hypothetical protein
MICLVNVEKLKRFTKRDNLKITEVNLLTLEGADLAIHHITELFKHRGGKYHLRFWIGGSFHNKGHIIRECIIAKNNVIFLDE